MTPVRSAILLAAAMLSASIATAHAAAPPPSEPQLTGTLSRNAGQIGGRERSFLLYLPKDFKEGAPLLIVLHGNTQDSKDIRITTGYEFDMLADKYGFAVVYPDGIGRSWNACRKQTQRGPKPADDVGFIEAIIAHQAAVTHIDPKRVFAAGYSSGGAMSYRLALERPLLFAGIAAMVSSMPALSDMSCQAQNRPVPMLMLNGTADPETPYQGGTGAARNAGSDPISGSVGSIGMSGTDSMNAGDSMSGRMPARGGAMVSPLIDVRRASLSIPSVAQYWAKVNGQDGIPQVTYLPHKNPDDPTSVDVTAWTAPGKPPVVLYTMNGGGHVVPQPYFHYPSIVGKQTEDIDAPELVWEFFSNLPSRP